MLEVFLIIASAVLFPVLHLANGWLFGFAEISPHVGLIYMPAFLRLLNFLLLGRFRGTVATALGGVLLMQSFGEPSLAEILNIACSVTGPLAALFLFRTYRGRDVSLTSLRDLAELTLVYCIINAMVHHWVWFYFDPAQLGSPQQIFFMMLGDLNGALLGAYLLKWTASHLDVQGPRR
jgi:hypothetical protein